MIHKLYEGDVAADEAVKGAGVKALSAFRVKTKSGRYVIVLTDGDDKAVKDWAKKQGQETDAPAEPAK